MSSESQSTRWGILLALVTSLLHGSYWSGVISSVKTCLLQQFWILLPKGRGTRLVGRSERRLAQEVLHHSLGCGAAFDLPSPGGLWLRELPVHSPLCIQVIITTRTCTASPAYPDVVTKCPLFSRDNGHQPSQIRIHPNDFILQ